VKVLVVGDSYCPVSVFAPPFERLAGEHVVEAFDIADEPSWVPSTASERSLKEFLGSPRQVIERLHGHDVLVVQAAPVTDDMLQAAPSLRLVCVARGGPVNVDVAAATARGIPVVITPGKNAQAVAELTLAFIVMLARRMPGIARYLEGGGELARDNYEGARWFGHDIEGHVLGIVGFGQIGVRVAHLAIAYGMRVLAFDPYVDPARMVAAGAEPCTDLDAMLAAADYVSLHARSNADNRGLISRERVALMRPGSYLVNTSRDTLIDEDAVHDALVSDHLAGAAFDIVRPPDLTTPPELGRRHRLLDAPNVVLAPHIGGATYETLAHGGEMAVAEILRLAGGEPLRNCVNPTVVRESLHA